MLIISRHLTGIPVVLSLFATATCFNSIARVVSADDRRTVISCHSTGVRSILSFRLDSLDSMIDRVVSADAWTSTSMAIRLDDRCFVKSALIPFKLHWRGGARTSEPPESQNATQRCHNFRTLRKKIAEKIRESDAN